MAGRRALDIAREVYPSRPQPSGTAPTPQGGPGS